MRMKRKRKEKRPCSSSSLKTYHGPAAKKQQMHDESSKDVNKTHILSLLDELETHLAPSAPEIHRVRIPPPPGMAVGARGGAEFVGNGNGGFCPSSKGVIDGGWDQLKLSPEGFKEPSQCFVEGFEKLLEMKFGIMALRIRHGLDAWTLGSHMVNPFEVVSYVAATSTLNRAYFKMWELIQTFQLVPSVSKNQRFLSAHLCEGPGGFIEALLEYRARSSTISEEDSQDRQCKEAADKELHRRDDSSPKVNRKPGLCRGRTSISKGDNQDTFKEGVDENLFHIRDHPSPMVENDGTKAHQKAGAYRATSPIPEEFNQDTGEQAMEEEELHARDLSSLLDHGTKAHHLKSDGSGNPSAASPYTSLKSNNRSEDLSCRSTISHASGAVINGKRNVVSTDFTDGARACSPKAGLGSACAAGERSSVFEVDKTRMSMAGGYPRATLLLNDYPKASTHSSSAEINKLSELERVVHSRNLEESETATENSHHRGNLADNLPEPSLSSCVKKTSSVHYHDLWFGLTLAASSQQGGTEGSPPPMMEMTRLNKKVRALGDGNSQGHLHFGMDGSGDLTNPANVNAFVEYTLSQTDGQRMDLITADGAFDVSEDFSSQEHSHLHLVFCEVVSALRLQAKGGSFVLKLFDCYTASTLTILFILSSLYRSVEIVRLRTTRVCNSERYVVAEGFSGLNPQLESILLRLDQEWSISAWSGDKVGLFLAGGFPEKLLQVVMENNAAISALQMDGINRALQLADVIGESLSTTDSYGKRKGLIGMLRRKLQTQKRMQRNAISLCKALNIPCRSQFCMD